MVERGKGDATPQWVLLLFLVLVGLFAITLIYGMFTGTLDATVVAMGILTTVAGLGTTVLAMRQRNGGDRS